jgi:hypothetical protein
MFFDARQGGGGTGLWSFASNRLLSFFSFSPFLLTLFWSHALSCYIHMA